MPRTKNTTARILVPLVALVLGLVAIWGFAGNSGPGQTPTQTPDAAAKSANAAGAPSATATAPAPVGAAPSQANTQPAGAAPATPARAPGTSDAGPPAVVTTVSGTVDVSKLRARTYPGLGYITGTEVGSLDASTGQWVYLKLSGTGAGVGSMQLSRHFTSIEDVKHVEVQAEHAINTDVSTQLLTPFAALGVNVSAPGSTSSTWVGLAADPKGPIWRPVAGSAQTFEAIVEDEGGQSILRVVRSFRTTQESYEVELHQRIENLSGAPLVVRWHQMGPVDLWQDSMSYGGDKRRMRFGYLLSPPKDPAQSTVLADAFSVSRADVVGSAGAAGLAPEKVQWPNSKSQAEAYSLSWLGFTNRYFAAAVYPLIDVKSSKVEKRLAWVGDVVRVIPTAVVNAPGAEVVGLRMDSVPVTLAAGGSADLSHGIFAGPMDKRVLTGVPRLASLGLKGLPHYNFGGPCAFCTFETITSFLLWLLTKIHLIVGDWAIGIFILVVIVRTCLHPITKSTQIRMARFGKQMAAVGPKQKQLQEKYKNDPRKLQEETAKLWREEGISPAGLLGCLPTFLQTPVWIALSATLYFAVELRHQHAFFGLFQSIQPKVSPFWHFLGDLAEPDRLLYFGHSVANLPLLGSIESVNILPIILGIVLFIQQKYMTPPATTTLTPEQEFQQKLTKWMMVIMFPLMMYNAPSGLALYFLVNSTLGILEARYVRAHMEKYDLLNLDKQKAAKAAKKGGGGGFMERLQAAAEEKRAEYERRAKEQNKRGGR